MLNATLVVHDGKGSGTIVAEYSMQEFNNFLLNIDKVRKLNHFNIDAWFSKEMNQGART